MDSWWLWGLIAIGVVAAVAVYVWLIFRRIRGTDKIAGLLAADKPPYSPLVGGGMGRAFSSSEASNLITARETGRPYPSDPDKPPPAA